LPVAQYRFLTTWCLDAPIAVVYEAIHDSERWPHWWRGVEKVVKLRPGDELGVGELTRYTWKSRLPYRLEFEMETTLVEPPFRLEGRARGELEGEGRWRMFEGPGTCVTYDWSVQTTERWMNLLAPLAKPVFAWNHDVVMRQGGVGLARFLGAPLIALG
jgi:uncharacterized protein YndB with AHSA1/START domain